MKTTVKLGDTVRLKPLLWIGVQQPEATEPWHNRAETVFCQITVDYLSLRPRSRRYWYFCIPTEDGEDWVYTKVRSREDGIRVAEAWYLDKIREAVECLPSCTT